MRFVHEKEVMERFPDNCTCVIGNVEIDENVADRLEVITKESLEKAKKNTDYTCEIVSLWQQIFVRMGAKPKYDSSLTALKKRFEAKGQLYDITPIVNFYNSYSLCGGVPMAAYDESKMINTLTLREAKKGELFTPLGNPGQQEKTKNNEVIYADEEKVVCRYWNLQDCNQTKISSDTRKVMFIFDIISTDTLNPEIKYQQIVKDFESLFGNDIFHGLTGQRFASELEW